MGHFGPAGIAVVAQRLGAGRIERRQQVGRRHALLVEDRTERGPRLFLLGANFFLGLLAKGVQFFLGGRPLFHEELRHLTDAIVLCRPRQPFFRLVPLVRPRRAVTLGLGDFFDVHQHGNVVFTATLRGVFVGGHEAGVIPPFDPINDQTVGGFFTLESGQGRGNALLHRLVFLGHRNAIPVVPHTHEHGHFKHTSRIHRFPKQPLGRARIADGAHRDFVAAVGERRHVRGKLGRARNTLLAWANPTNRGIWPPVGLMSAELLKSAIKSFHVPSSFNVRVAKCPPI